MSGELIKAKCSQGEMREDKGAVAVRPSCYHGAAIRLTARKAGGTQMGPACRLTDGEAVLKAMAGGLLCPLIAGQQMLS